jgi:hypothetical protein
VGCDVVTLVLHFAGSGGQPRYAILSYPSLSLLMGNKGNNSVTVGIGGVTFGVTCAVTILDQGETGSIL